MNIKLLSDNAVIIFRAIFTDTYNTTDKDKVSLTSVLSDFGAERRVRGVKKCKSDFDIVEKDIVCLDICDQDFSTSTKEFFESLSDNEVKALTGVIADAEDSILGNGFKPYVEFMMDGLVEQVEIRPIRIEEIWGM
jgi:hypothetical protein